MKLSLLRGKLGKTAFKSKLSFVFISILSLFVFSQTFAQTATTYNYTGAVQYYTVPPCVNQIQVTCAGAQGGGPIGNNAGGKGAIMTGTIVVTPGDIIEVRVGGEGQQVTGGWNGGGVGHGIPPATAGNMHSYGGGGASDVRITPYGVGQRMVVGGGGGGTASQSGQYTIPGGNGGCVNGFTGAGSPFTGTGGGGGTQLAPGAGGPPWGSNASWGSPGVGPVGGAGAPFYNNTTGTAGGGGGGGYFGGGGGGADGCCPSANGAGAGGGGSSYAANQISCIQGVTGNTGDGYITILASGGVNVSSANNGVYCEGATIQLNASAALSYLWSGPNGFTSTLQNVSIPNCTVADSGLYILTATILGGCTITDSIVITVVPAIVPTAGIDDTVCFGSAFALTGTTTVGTDPFSWTYYAPTVTPAPGVTFAPASNILNPFVTVTQPGLYNFIITEVNPVCGIVRDTVEMFVKQMDIQTLFTDPLCAGAADGTITATGTDATEFSYDNGATWSSLPGSGFTAGTYDVCVRDANLCQACMQVTLTDPPAIVLSLSNDTLVCENGTASLIASANNGSGFIYNWTQFPTTVDTQYGSPSADTYYTVQAMSANGCFSNIDSIYVTVRPPISGTISPDASICPGYNTMQTATALDGIGAPYTFTWSDGTIGTGSSHSYLVSPPVTQVYTVTITDGCESTPLVLTNTITVDPVPVPTFIADTTDLCEPAEFDLWVTTNPADFVTASWLLSDGQFYVNLDTIQTTPMMEGNYSVQLVMTNQYGCIDSVTYPNYLVSHPLPVAKFKFYPGIPTMFSTDVQFTNFSVNAASSFWTFESGDPATSMDTDPSSTFPEGEVGFYDVELAVTSDFGCVDTAMQTVEVKPEVLLYAPNTFTPDGDEFNPNWRVHIVGVDIQEFKLEIRNRWGELIWESNDVDGEWDGTYNNTPVPTGTYNWFIRAKDLVTDEPYIFKGHVNVLK